MTEYILETTGDLFINGVKIPPPEPEPPIIEPEPEEPAEPTEFLFPEDWAEEQVQSTPSNIVLPKGISNLFDVEYLGAFRVESGGGKGSNSAVGSLGFNAKNHSLFLAGHMSDGAIAEFKIPDALSFSDNVRDMPKAEVLQSYAPVLEGTGNNRINGILQYSDYLLVTSEIYYDANGKNKNNLQVLNVDDLTQPSKPILQLEGEATIAGYMSPIPENMQMYLGGKYLVGWSSIYAINNRYSQGPSMAIFDPQTAIDSDLDVPVNIKQVYPFSSETMIVDNATDTTMSPSPIWSLLAKGRYGFIIPDTSLFLVVGSNGGIHSGIGYKITQDTGKTTGGYASYREADNYNYFWLFDISRINEQENKWDNEPISYGKWSHPIDGKVLGGAFDEKADRLYLTIQNAGQVGQYDRPPLIITYKITSKDFN